MPSNLTCSFVTVERGLLELRKLGIEEHLWEVSRREIAQEAANQKIEIDTNA